MNGLAEIQSGEIVSYSVSYIPGQTFTWSVTPNGTILSSQGYNSIIIQWNGLGPGQVNVSWAGGSDLLNTNIIPPGTISGPDQTIPGTVQVYQVPASTGSNLQWIVSPGSTIIGPDNQTAVAVQWDTTPGLAWVEILDSGTPVQTLQVSLQDAPISGLNTVPFDAVTKYKTTLAPGLNFQWDIYGNGTLLTSGISGPVSSIPVQWSGPGNAVIQLTTGPADESFVFPVYSYPLTADGPTEADTDTMTPFSMPYLASPPFSYTWELLPDGDIVSSTQNKAVLSWSAAGPKVIKTTDGNGNLSYFPVYVWVDDISGLNYGPANVQMEYSLPFDSSAYTWTVISNGSIFSNGAENQKVITWSGTGFGVVEVRKSSGDSYIKIIKLASESISGINAAQLYTQNMFYVPYTSGNTYSWSVTGGSVVRTEDSCIQVWWDTTGQSIISLSINGAEPEIKIVSVVDNGVSGGTGNLVNATQTYSIPFGPSGAVYDWYISDAKGTFTTAATAVPTVDVQWTIAGELFVIAVDSAGEGYCLPVSILDAPTPMVSGSTTGCGNGPQLTYSTPFADGHFYDWEVSGGDIVSQDKNSIVVQWTEDGTGTVTVTESNDGGSAPNELDVTLHLIPDAAIVGNSIAGAGETYTYFTRPSSNDFAWVVSGGTIMSGQGTSSVEIFWHTVDAQATGNLQVTETGSGLCSPTSSSDSLDITIKPVPAPQITGDDLVCESVTKTYTAFDSGNDLLWEVEGGTILSGQGTASIQVTWDATVTRLNGVVRLTESNTVSSPNSITAEKTVIVTPVPNPVIAGPILAGQGSISEFYCTDSGNSFSWSVGGATILSGQGTNRISVLWSALSQETSFTVSVTETASACAPTQSTATLQVNVKPIPVPQILLGGTPPPASFNVCSGSTMSYYCPDNGNDFYWEVEGGQITGSPTSSSIDVLWDSVSERTPARITLTEKNSVTNPGTVTVFQDVCIYAQPQPSITGQTDPIEGSYCAYSVAPTGNQFSWIVTSADGTIITHDDINTICVSWNNSSGQVSVTESTPFNIWPSASSSVNVSVSASASSSDNFATKRAQVMKLRESRDSVYEAIYLKRERLALITKQLDRLADLGYNTNPGVDIIAGPLAAEKDSLTHDFEIDTTLSPPTDILTHAYQQDSAAANEWAGYIYDDGQQMTSIVSNLNNNVPISLFPLRVETKFKLENVSGTDKYKIRIRVYPDDIAINTHEEALMPLEIEAGRNYWKNAWPVYNDKVQLEPVWLDFIKTYTPQRAAWIAEKVKPANFSNLGTDPYPIFAAVDQKNTSWTRQPETKIMPAQFVAVVYYKSSVSADYTELTQIPGALVSDRLKVGIDPSDEQSLQLDKTNPDDPKVVFGAGTEWMGDYTQALTQGMALEEYLTGISGLTNTDIENGYFKVIVAGVKYTSDETESQHIVEGLMDNHHYTSTGIEIARIGDQVQNAMDSDSTFGTKDAYTHSFDAEQKGLLYTPVSDNTGKTDGQRLADALGINNSVFQNIRNADATDIAAAMKMNTLLWPATMGYYLGDLWYEEVSSTELESARDFFASNVLARGVLPSLRVHKQIYGIQPVTTFLSSNKSGSPLMWTNTDPDELNLLNNLSRLANLLFTKWQDASANVIYAGSSYANSTQKNQNLMDIISLQPVSMDYYHRFAIGLDLFWNLYGLTDNPSYTYPPIPSDAVGWFNDRLNAIQSLWSSMGFTTTHPLSHDYGKMLRLLFYENARGKMIKGLVQNTPVSSKTLDSLSGIAGTNPTYLDWMIGNVSGGSIDFDRLNDEDFSGISNAVTPQNLFFILSRHAILLQYWRGAAEIYYGSGGSVTDWTDTEFLNFGSITTTHPGVLPSDILPTGQGKYQVLQQLYSPGVTLKDHLNAYMTAPLPHTPQQDRLMDMHNAIAFLNSLPSATLDLLLREHLDLCAYRIDAWITGLASYRLAQQRSSPSNGEGLYIGAYGWVENIKVKTRSYLSSGAVEGITDPVEDPSGRLGYIHGPSMNHASAAALLKSGYDAVEDRNWGSTYGYPKRITLSSERTRRALAIIEGVRNGQEFGAILGFEFERTLQESLAPLGLQTTQSILDIFRSAYTFDSITPPAAGTDIKTAQSVLLTNGFKLYQQTRQRSATTYPSIGLPDESTSQEGPMIVKSLDILAELVDAIGDLTSAEAVYQIAQGQFDSGFSMMNAVQKGDNVPNEVKVVDTAPSGGAVTLKLSLQIPNSSSSGLTGWAEKLSVRAIADQALNNWYGTLLGSGKDIFCTIRYLAHDSSNANSTGYVYQNVSAYDLGFQPCDLVYVNMGELTNDESELSQKIRVYARKTYALDVATDIFIDYQSREHVPSGTGIVDPKTFYEILPLLKQIRKITGDSKYATPADYLRPNVSIPEDSESGLDIGDFFNRILNASDELDRLKTDLQTAYDRLTPDTYHADDIDGLRTELSRAFDFGIAGTQTIYVLEKDENARTEVLARAKGVLDILNNTITEADAIKATLYDANASDPYLYHAMDAKQAISTITDWSKILLGNNFRILPRFKVFNSAELTTAFSNSASILPASKPLIVQEWFHGATKVRSRLNDLDMLNILSELLAANQTVFKPIQLPLADNDFWYAVQPDSSQKMTDDKYSVVFQVAPSQLDINGVYDFTGWQSGYIIDEWTEIIPDDEQTTGVAFHYDTPRAKAPNAVLLAVSPTTDANWDWNNVLAIINDSLAMVKARSVDPDLLAQGPMGHVLKALMTAYQPGGETLTSNVEQAFIR